MDKVPSNYDGDTQTEKNDSTKPQPRDVSVVEANALDFKPKSYIQRIALITPAHNLRGYGFKQYIKKLGYTLNVFTFPAVIYSGLQWGAVSVSSSNVNGLTSTCNIQALAPMYVC